MTTLPTVTSADVAAAEQLFETWIGFDFGGAAPRRLQDFLVSRAARLGYETVSQYLADLPPRRPNTTEAQRLVNVVTNGLTAFWRDAQQTEALGVILEQLGERQKRPLAVWCAGCATGEEAYTVAMLAAETQVDVRVLGTDVNTLFLDAARRADFDDWSLRRLSADRRQRWFDYRDKRWALSPAVASAVEFRHHNLLELPPVAPTETGAWDIILCRNVMIYLTEESTASILLRFASVLAEDGYLLLGSSEQLTDSFAPFRATRHGPTFVFRPVRLDPAESMPIPISEVPVLDELQSLDEETIDFTERDAVRQLLTAGVDHAAKGAVDNAIACYEAAAGYDPFTPEIHALLACAVLGEGATDRALDALGKVLFLDPLNWWAASQRAHLFEGRGDMVEARRQWRRASEGLEANHVPFDELLALGPIREVRESLEEVRAACAHALRRLTRP